MGGLNGGVDRIGVVGYHKANTGKVGQMSYDSWREETRSQGRKGEGEGEGHGVAPISRGLPKNGWRRESIHCARGRGMAALLLH